jgi:DNA-binding transcriptional LysR family regulator
MNSPRLDQLRIRQMRFLCRLASTGTLAATAEQLSLTPPAASMLLKEIEGLVGCKLFRRQGRGMAPTDEGQALLPRCRAVLGEVDAMGTMLRGPRMPLLRVGAFPHTTTTVLPAHGGCPGRRPPAWRLQIVDASADAAVAACCCAVRSTCCWADCQRRPLVRPPSRAWRSARCTTAGCRWWRHASTRWSGRRSVALAELLQWPWILPGLESTTRVALVEAFMGQGLEPPVPVAESPSFFYSLSVVAQTDLLTCLRHSAALQNSHSTAILPAPLVTGTTPVSMVWRKTSGAAQRAVDQLAAAGVVPPAVQGKR